jgi:MFS family permease
MIASHLPSNVLLLAVPLMPTDWAAAAMLVARFSISQMDVPARQAYVVMVVASDERSAAGGITGVVRSLGMSLSPLLLGYLTSYPVSSIWFSSPWVIAVSGGRGAGEWEGGGEGPPALYSLPPFLARTLSPLSQGLIKIFYDIILYGLYLTDDSLKQGESNAAAADRSEAKAAASGSSAEAPLLERGSEGEGGGEEDSLRGAEYPVKGMSRAQ